MLKPYHNYNCRSFDQNLLVQNFNLERFSGEWYNQYISKNNNQNDNLFCKFTLIENSSSSTSFIKRDIYVQNDYVSDKFYRSSSDPHLNSSSFILWEMGPAHPRKNKYSSKFEVLSTDYDHFAIVQLCAQNKFTSKLQGDEQIVIYTRDNLAKNYTTGLFTFQLTDQNLQSKIENEFIKLFGPRNDSAYASLKGFKQFDFNKDMQKISQDGCEELIPAFFDFLNKEEKDLRHYNSLKWPIQAFKNKKDKNVQDNINSGDKFK